MGGRGSGRPSVEAAKVKVVEGGFGRGRIAPPEDLTPEEQEIWRRTVGSEDTGFFDSAALQDMLKDYCRHRGEVDRITSIIKQFKTEWLKNADGAARYGVLLKARDAEARAAADKATKLRMTNQSRYTPKTAATAHRHSMKAKLPWEDDEEEAAT